MFYCDGFLHAIVDTGSSATEDGETKSNNADFGREGISKQNHERAPSTRYRGETSAANSNTDRHGASTSRDSSADGEEPEEKPLSRKQRQKAKRKLNKQRAKDLKKRHHRVEDDGSAGDETSMPRKRANDEAATVSSDETMAQTRSPPLRLHQFVSTVFRSELNVAENGAGYFVKNAPKVSAHHAILRGAVRLNGEVCKAGRTALNFGDDVALHLEPAVIDGGKGRSGGTEEGELTAWRGSKGVAETLEGNAVGERRGRMTALPSSMEATYVQKDASMNDCEMIKYYREKLGKAWKAEVHESAMKRPLPLTLRVLKPSDGLAGELRGLGFRPVTEEDDFSLWLSSSRDCDETKRLNRSATKELLRDTWIARGDSVIDPEKDRKSDEKRLGIFLSEARVTGEMMQQELTSMLPVAILAADLKDRMRTSRRKQCKDLRFLDLCSAPGSKTCQLLSTLDGIASSNAAANDLEGGFDYAVVANELSPQRAEWMRQRLHQQGGGESLSHLAITCADGCAHAQGVEGTTPGFDYVLCDVPCSGDGTVRKSPAILGKWSPRNGAKNKALQKRLLATGLGLLKPSGNDNGDGDGGFLVYSTCSMNPSENEEVISEVIEEMNYGREDAFRYKLVDLSAEPSSNNIAGDDWASCDRDNINNVNSSDRMNSNFLRVLPAKSHGGFFVAVIRKVTRGVAGVDEPVAAEPNAKEGDFTIHHSSKHSLVHQEFGTKNESKISYSVSPCTQRCVKELVTKLGASAVVSSGAAALYESNDNGAYVLQQGCASLASPKHQKDVAHLRLSRSELEQSHAKCPGQGEVLLPMGGLRVRECLIPGTPLIIEVGSSSPGDGQSFLLPARILRVTKDDGDSAAGAEELVAAKILARPQIFKRALLSFSAK